ncbi:hypothetical protein FB451DRAFT_1234696 [Mycena latifolia]|nr:hypothetical protein FB451DRAFT_1234696 [Mycena latifolia]
MFAYTNEHMRAETLGVLRYTTAPEGPPDSGRGPDPTELEESALVPANPVSLPSAALAIPFIFSIQRTHFQNWRSTARAADVGTKVWPGDQLIATIDGVQAVDFIINNLDDAGKHGYKPWIMATGRGRLKVARTNLNATNPMRRDTFFVPARGWTVVRIVPDTLAIGPVVVQPAAVAEVPLPADIVAHCQSWLI